MYQLLSFQFHLWIAGVAAGNFLLDGLKSTLLQPILDYLPNAFRVIRAGGAYDLRCYVLYNTI